MSSCTFDTVWPADSVEFCPHPDAYNIFACGTYNLEKQDNDPSEDANDTKKPQVRRGKCVLFSVEDENKLSHLYDVELPAVLDMKWCHRISTEAPLLGVADSEGGLSLQQLDVDSKILRQIQRVECAASDTLCLSLDWNNRRNPTAALGEAIVSLSDGSLALLKPTEHQGLSVADTWHAHDYEPWIAAWNYWDTNVIYSGGDDLTMKGWDSRQGFEQPIFTNRRFEAGVTTIQSHPFTENLIAVGSYNDTVYLFDTRNPLKPLTRTNVGGGAWRVKWHPSPLRKNNLLVACMHDGCKILHFDMSGGGDAMHVVGGEAEVIKRLDEHESMAYGADWSYAGAASESVIASCSFYDHKLCLWKG